MNPFAIVFLLLCSVALLRLPRRWAALPLLVGCCYMTPGQGIEVGPLHFTVIRILFLVGLIRILARSERIAGGMVGADWLMLVWGGWCLLSAAFHKPPGEALVFRLGVVYNTVGFYFLFRCFCHDFDDVVSLIKMLAILLFPVALEMVQERVTRFDYFGLLGGVPTEILIRDDKLRAQGPFGHPILAGTVGAVCFPLMMGLWSRYRKIALLGFIACGLMIYACASSGPIMTLAAGLFGLGMWRYRRYTRQARWAGLLGYLALNLVMNRPAYYIIGEIDLTGSSTGWHRAALIESSIDHLGEWWLAGTDYTRHWMATGVSWSENHTDITNHYLLYGVDGGLPLMFLYIALLVAAFRYLGRGLDAAASRPFEHQFLIWCVGASLLAHVFTGVSVAYTDQSYIFLYACIAMSASLVSLPATIASEGHVTNDENDSGQSLATGVATSHPWLGRLNP